MTKLSNIFQKKFIKMFNYFMNKMNYNGISRKRREVSEFRTSSS